VSVVVMAAVWDLPLATTEKMVLLVISDHASEDGTNAYPSIATIARKASISPRQAQRIVAGLESSGLIRIEKQAGGPADMRADRRPNRYTVLLNAMSSMSSRRTNGVTMPTQRGDMEGTDGVTRMSPKPSIEPSTIEPSLTPAVPTGVHAGEVVAAFVDEFRTTHRSNPPNQTLARIGRDARTMLENGEYAGEVLLDAAKEAARFGHANLPSAVLAVLTAQTGGGTRRGPATAADRIAGLARLIGGQE
jgi:Helix-turn-helix domain